EDGFRLRRVIREPSEGLGLTPSRTGKRPNPAVQDGSAEVVPLDDGVHDRLSVYGIAEGLSHEPIPGRSLVMTEPQGVHGGSRSSEGSDARASDLLEQAYLGGLCIDCVDLAVEKGVALAFLIGPWDEGHLVQ